MMRRWYHPLIWRLSSVLLNLSEHVLRWSVALSPYRTIDGVAKYYRFLLLDDETVLMTQELAQEDGVGPEDVIGASVYATYHERHTERFMHKVSG